VSVDDRGEAERRVSHILTPITELIKQFYNNGSRNRKMYVENIMIIDHEESISNN